MTDPLSLLRQYNVNKKEIIEREGNVIFGEFCWPEEVRTKYAIHTTKRSHLGSGSGEKVGNEEYYTLGCLLFFLKNAALPHPEYVRKAAAENILTVRRPDRKNVLAYLNGDIASFANIGEKVIPGTSRKEKKTPTEKQASSQIPIEKQASSQIPIEKQASSQILTEKHASSQIPTKSKCVSTTLKSSQHIPSTTSKRDATGALVSARCIVCLRDGREDTKTVYVCGVCPGKPALCPRECFGRYHTA